MLEIVSIRISRIMVIHNESSANGVQFLDGYPGAIPSWTVLVVNDLEPALGPALKNVCYRCAILTNTQS